ncbi:MAG: hypothetical protein ACI9H8_001900 [Lysobacterales bacterium]|jgi:hypothetical protein
MNTANVQAKEKPLFAWISLGIASLPFIFLGVLLIGGSSSGFAVWNDVFVLLLIMVGSALVGIALSLVSIRRKEQSTANVIALFTHIFLILFAAWAFNQ